MPADLETDPSKPDSVGFGLRADGAHAENR